MSERQSIVMYVPGMRFNAESLTQHSLGGSETAGLCVAKELAKLGHEVKVFANTPQIHNDGFGVRYFPLDFFRRFALVIPHDVCIAQRAPVMFGARLESTINVLWVHDLAMLRQMQQVRTVLWNVDKIFTVSKYHEKQYRETFSIPDGVIYPTRNGINLDMIPEPRRHDGPGKQVVYTARPERGLDVLLEKIMPRIWARDPEVKLVVAAYDNTVDEMRDFYARLHGLMRQAGNKIRIAGALTKPDLYKLYAESDLYLYPTPSPVNPLFSEVSCITAMECMACGLPFVSTNRGALPETLNSGAGVLLDEGDGFIDSFVEETIALLGDPGRRQGMADAGVKHSKSLDWSGVAKDWVAGFDEWIRERSKNPKTVINNLLRKSDVIAAEELAKKTNDQEALKTIDGLYGWKNIPAKMTEHYDLQDQIFDDTPERMSHTPRAQYVITRLRETGMVAGRMLDYGCNQGCLTICISDEFPDLKITGADISSLSLGKAVKNRDEYAKHPENIEFVKADDLGDDRFDVLFLGEVLEHVNEPWKLIDFLERYMKPGGLVVITTPYGPWEEDSYGDGVRQHLWELDFFALRDMLHGKSKVSIEQAYTKNSHIQAKAQGVCVATYHVMAGKKCDPVSMWRKHNFQAVRQTVSVSMICGGPSVKQTLGWCLESIKGVADEIIIGDTGMDVESRKIAKRYGAKLVEAPSPLEVGFDEARNATLPHCKMDWILWIDSDEKLINPDQVHKYLRPNCFTGYGIRQHHFSIDANFKPDMPIRLFRNHQGLRFWGSCHEHPETEINKGPGLTIVLSDVHIAHVGYLNESTRRVRFGRNYPLMEMSRKKYPDRILNHFFTMRDEMLLVNYRLQGTNGRPDDYCRVKAQGVIDIYREHFCGKSIYMSEEALKYYSDACRVLGVGAEIALNLSANKTGEPQIAPARYRYASVDDLQTDLETRAKQVMEPYCNPMW